MNERKQKLETIFQTAMEMSSRDQREAYLKGACAADPDLRSEVQELLKAAEAAEAVFQRREKGGFLGRAALDAGATLAADVALSEGPGSRIGRYRLLQQIGEGGMGTVYMAEQEQPVRRRVALKIIKLGMDTKSVIARFEAERQALALMDHPNIARVLDGGATDAGRCRVCPSPNSATRTISRFVSASNFSYPS